jgi:CHRD domain
MKSLLFKNTASRLALTGLLALSAGLATAAETKVTLTGAQETPAVATSATGNGTITVAADKSVSGSVTTKGIVGTAAHIHLAAVGQKGPPVISLAKTAEDVWSVPAGSKLTDEQYASYQAGNLYINVHSAENKGGEIRGQLQP